MWRLVVQQEEPLENRHPWNHRKCWQQLFKVRNDYSWKVSISRGLTVLTVFQVLSLYSCHQRQCLQLSLAVNNNNLDILRITHSKGFSIPRFLNNQGTTTTTKKHLNFKDCINKFSLQWQREH